MNAAANNIIKSKRLKLGLSQKQLAQIADVSINTIYNIENNRVIPNLQTYEKVCKALGIKMSRLL